MPVPELLLIKHSLPEIIPGQPAAEWRLSQAGRERCAALAQIVAAHQPQALYCSCEPKAHETAGLIAGRLGLTAQPAGGLHEHVRRQAPFSSRQAFEAAIRGFFAHPAELVYGEESADQAAARFQAAVSALLDQHPGQSLAIAAHGTVITLFVQQTNRLSPFEFWRKLGLPSLVILERPSLRLVQVVEQIE